MEILSTERRRYHRPRPAEDRLLPPRHLPPRPQSPPQPRNPRHHAKRRPPGTRRFRHVPSPTKSLTSPTAYQQAVRSPQPRDPPSNPPRPLPSRASTSSRPLSLARSKDEGQTCPARPSTTAAATSSPPKSTASRMGPQSRGPDRSQKLPRRLRLHQVRPHRLPRNVPLPPPSTPSTIPPSPACAAESSTPTPSMNPSLTEGRKVRITQWPTSSNQHVPPPPPQRPKTRKQSDRFGHLLIRHLIIDSSLVIRHLVI